jgi:thiol:disulfide interchange protein DsbC
MTTYQFNKLPLSEAVKVGSGKKQIAVFVDPDCPYCQQLELYLSKNINKLTVYYFFIPLPMHPMAKEHIQQILCSTSPAKAIDTIMIKKLSVSTPEKSCISRADSQITKIQKYSSENGINATPFIITDSNTVIGGFDTNALDNYLGAK